MYFDASYSFIFRKVVDLSLAYVHVHQLQVGHHMNLFKLDNKSFLFCLMHIIVFFFEFVYIYICVCVNCLFFKIQKRKIIEQTMHVLKRFTLYVMAHCKSIEQYRKKKSKRE